MRREQISDHLTWAGANAARAHGLKYACHVTWPLYMLEEVGLLPPRSLASLAGMRVRDLRSCRLSPTCMKPAGPPRAMLERVRQLCLGGVEGSLGGLVLVTSSFGIEPPRPLPPFIKVIGRGHRLETVDALSEHQELKVCFLVGWEGCAVTCLLPVLRRQEKRFLRVLVQLLYPVSVPSFQTVDSSGRVVGCMYDALFSRCYPRYEGENIARFEPMPECCARYKASVTMSYKRCEHSTPQ